MPFTLAMYLYRSVQEKIQSNFEKDNIILSFDDVENLEALSDKDQMVDIFKSAIVDHHVIEGKPYFLVPPITSMFYHDTFKRCVIAEALADLANLREAKYKDDVRLILFELIDSNQAGFVQVFAWHALGNWLVLDKNIFDDVQENLGSAFSGPTASVLGALIFLEQAAKYVGWDAVVSVIEKNVALVRFRTQQALIQYFMYRYRCKFKNSIDVGKIPEFLNTIKSQKYYTQKQIEMGLQEIGLIPGSGRGGVWPGTQQANIARRIHKIARDYIPVIGCYLLQEW